MKYQQSGISVGISNPVVSAVQTADQMRRAAQDTSDPRMQALAAATTGLAAQNAYDTVEAGQNGNLADQAGGVNLGIGFGASKSSSKSTTASTTTAASTIAARRDVSIVATGGNGTGGKDGDITVTGSAISAGRDAALLADGDITLQAARNTSTLQSNNKTSGASVGVSVNLAVGVGVTAGGIPRPAPVTAGWIGSLC